MHQMQTIQNQEERVFFCIKKNCAKFKKNTSE